MTKSSFAGDELIKTPKKTIMNSIKINAPAEKIWPWIVQLGSGRAGWYSYDRIDNGGNPSATKIIPELQNIKVGDIFPAVPTTKDAFVVQQFRPCKDIILVVPFLTDNEEPNRFKRMNGKLRVSWLLALEPIDEKRTMLISRGRVSNEWLKQSTDNNPPKALILIELIYSLLAKMPWFIVLPIALIGHSIMESKMLRGIKRRAEAEC